ncbi:hypothetical protein KDW61_31540 [Burkholderia cenocepacia]|uniref:hypothetical protein n=1 Tax=Burkholderia TaxID=32008 RepID=UPI00158B8AF6|nr:MULTISPECIES: hypothetical protein [Burkholderia]MBR8213207.1 hypothetical protein [Burkholderia cenocepacia]
MAPDARDTARESLTVDRDAAPTDSLSIEVDAGADVKGADADAGDTHVDTGTDVDATICGSLTLAACATPTTCHTDSASSTADTAPLSTKPRSRTPPRARTIRNPLMITAP